jgi:hypothetical protein
MAVVAAAEANHQLLIMSHCQIKIIQLISKYMLLAMIMMMMRSYDEDNDDVDVYIDVELHVDVDVNSYYDVDIICDEV